MIEREPRREVEELELDFKELARRNTNLRELAYANLPSLKPRVRTWLRVGLEFPLGEVLTSEEEGMVRFYSGLNQGERMRSLAQTAAFIGKSPKAERLVAAHLRDAWLRLKRRELVGPEAVETLKLPRFLYRSLIRKKVAKVSQIPGLSREEIIRICGTDFRLSVLREAVQKKGIDLDLKIEFPLFTYSEREGKTDA